MPLNDKWISLVSKLNELTQKGKLTWEGPVESSNADTGRKYLDYFAKYRDKAFRLRRASGALQSTSPSGVVSKRAMAMKFYLGIVDADRSFLYSIPETVGFEDLYESIIYQRAGIRDLIDGILNED